MVQAADRQELLKSFSTLELTQELKRRFAELEEARALILGTSSGTGAGGGRPGRTRT